MEPDAQREAARGSPWVMTGSMKTGVAVKAAGAGGSRVEGKFYCFGNSKAHVSSET